MFRSVLLAKGENYMTANTFKDILINVGRKMEGLRKSKGLTQEDVSFGTGLDLKTYRNIEKGRTKMRIGTMQVLIDYFSQKLNCQIKLSYFKN